jgi:hypothetical protein
VPHANVQRQRCRRGLFVLALLSCCLCRAGGADAQQTPPVVLTVRLTVVVRDEGGRPVPDAEVNVSRVGRGRHGTPLMDISGRTDTEGRFTRQNTDFQLTGSSPGPPQTLTVTAPGYKPSGESLTDDIIQQGASNKGAELSREVRLEKAPADPSPADGAAAPRRGAEGAPLLQPGESLVSTLILFVVIALFVVLLAALVWMSRGRRGLAPTHAAEDSVVHHLRVIAGTLKSLRQEQSELLGQQRELLAEIVKNNEILSKGVAVIAIHEDSAAASPGARPDAWRPPEPAAGREGDGLPRTPPRQGAQSSYLGLINRRPVTPEPVYLEVEKARPVAGKLEDSNVYLSEVSHSQGALVLFTQDGEVGWVFPNPTIGFRSAALSEVFPALTEAEFAASRESIRPKRVRKVEARRWRIQHEF